jgi:hypothetical protein
MYPCANTEPAGGGSVEFCCGHEATNVSTCCANGGAFSVPVGQIVLRPYQLSSYLAPSPSISAAKRVYSVYYLSNFTYFAQFLWPVKSSKLRE